MNAKVRFGIVVALLALAWHPVAAQDQIPETSGFSGYVMAGAAHFDVASNLLEDLLRVDLVFGLGVRQEIRGAGIVAVSGLITPADLTFWADPYVEGVERQPTDLNFPGWRLRWGEIFGTGLELTVTDRYYKFDEESSGDWLISQNRLAPEQQSLLDRNGDILRVQALYRVDVKKRHRFEPAARWVDDRHDGAAIATTGYSLQLTYLYRSPKVIIDANVVYGSREAKEINPIYGTLLEADRWAAALTAFVPVKKFKTSVLAVAVGGELYRENTNINFLRLVRRNALRRSALA